MQHLTAVGLLAATVDCLMLVTVLTVWRVLIRARTEGPRSTAMAWPLLLALGWGALWIWYPPLAAARLSSPPGGQGIAIAAVVVGLVSLLALPGVRTYFRTADHVLFVRLGPWRIVYGALLVGLGLLGGLPAQFFWSAGAGDILVGLWALAILWRRTTVSRLQLVAWNAAGLADLLHVLVLGATFLRPFFLSHPELTPPLNLLPLVGVPMFIALHTMSLWGMSRRSARIEV
jgi:hypothetical protein